MEMDTQPHKKHHFGTSYIPFLVHHSCLITLLFSTFFTTTTTTAFDYADALSKSLLYFEAQRSGRIPYNQRVTWRDHSGLTDGLEEGVGPNSQSYPHATTHQTLSFTFLLCQIPSQTRHFFCVCV